MRSMAGLPWQSYSIIPLQVQPDSCRSSRSPRTWILTLRLLLKQEIVLVVVSKATNGTATLALNLYAARFLPPAEFGALTLCTTMLMLFDGMLGAAIDLSVVRLRPLERLTASGSPVEQAALSLKALGCLFCSAILTVAAPELGRLLLRQSNERPLFVLLSVAATAVLLLRSTQLGLQIRERYRSFAAIEFLNTIARVVCVVWVLHHGHASTFAIISSFAAGSSLALVASFTTLMRVSRFPFRLRLRDAGLVLRNAQNALFTYGLSAFVARLDILMVALLMSPAQLGLYGSAMTLACLPEIAATYLAPAFLPRIVPYCQQQIFVTFFRKFNRAVYAGTVICYGALLWGFARFGQHILPPRYSPAIPVTLFLLPGTLATTTLFPLSLNLLMLRGSRVFIYFDLLTAPLLVIGYIIAASQGIVAVAIVTSLFRVSKTVIVQMAAARAAIVAQTEAATSVA